MMWKSLSYHKVPVSPNVTAEPGMCWPVHVSPSSYTRRMLSSHLSQLCNPTHWWAETIPFCKWNAADPQGFCSHLAAFPQSAPEVLLLVCWRPGTESMQAALAPHVQCQRRMCDNTYLFAKQALIFPVSLQQDTLHEALSRAQPPCLGSLEMSATQTQRRNTRQNDQHGDQQAAGTSGHALVCVPSPSCKHLSCNRQMCRVRTSPSLSCLVLPHSHDERWREPRSARISSAL